MGIQIDREKRLESSGTREHLAKGEIDESFRLVLENGVNPHSVAAIQMRAMLNLRQSRFADAEKMVNTSLSMRDDAIGWKMKGDASYLQLRYEEAEQCYRKAHTLAPEKGDILHDLGVAIVSQGRTHECLECFQKAIEIEPHRADYRHHFAIMLLLDGQDAAGWDMMQHRMNVPGVCGTFPFPQKYWQGEDLAGKTIVVRTEQGWGDTIMFSRYFDWLSARAKKVYFYGQRALIPLVQHYFPGIACWPNDAPVPMEFDYHVNLMCFPRLIPEEVPGPRKRTARGAGVGVCWYGSPTHKADHLRSVPIEMFARFAEVLDEPLHSLGYGYFWKMENGIAVGENKPDFIEYCEVATSHDWNETAKVVERLDLVITVDTAIAHLAAFLGVETWLLLPYVPDFRWGMRGETTKWYESMRLYRQPKLFDWESVFAKVEEDLRARYPRQEERAA